MNVQKINDAQEHEKSNVGMYQSNIISFFIIGIVKTQERQHEIETKKVDLKILMY